MADELINGPAISSDNPLGLNSSASEQLSNLSHVTANKGDYRHALGELRDRSWKAHLTWERDAMLATGWRSKVTALVHEASKEATEASRQISKLLANTRKGFGLIDEVGSPVPADNIRLKDTLLAFELERNEPLNQIAEPPDSSPAGESIMPAQTTHQLASKAQAQAILASNKTYKSLKLNMSALAEAKKIEKAVRSGSLTRSTAVIKLNKLLSETEQIFFDAVELNIESELAMHWFMVELSGIREDLTCLRDKFSETIFTVSSPRRAESSQASHAADQTTAFI